MWAIRELMGAMWAIRELMWAMWATRESYEGDWELVQSMWAIRQLYYGEESLYELCGRLEMAMTAIRGCEEAMRAIRALWRDEIDLCGLLELVRVMRECWPLSYILIISVDCLCTFWTTWFLVEPVIYRKKPFVRMFFFIFSCLDRKLFISCLGWNMRSFVLVSLFN